MYRVLLVEDDEVLARITKFYLSDSGEYEVTWVSDAESALQMAKEQDLILLDIMLPGMDGMSLCQSLRKHVYCPIIFISCLDDENTIVHAFEIGGDDYLTKPFNRNILNARIKANLRRAGKTFSTSKYSCSRFTLDAQTHTVQRDDKSITLAPIEFGILQHLMLHPNTVFTADQLYEAVWEHPCYSDIRTVIVHLYNLRKIIEPDPDKPKYIKNLRGFGYLFDPDGK